MKKKNRIFHLALSSYSVSINDYLNASYKNFNFQLMKSDFLAAQDDYVLLSPAPNIDFTKLKQALQKTRNIFILLDYNHQSFEDNTELISEISYRKIFSPFGRFKDLIHCESIHGLMVKKFLESNSTQFSDDLFFVSQPFREDKRTGLDQYEILFKLVAIAKREHKKVFLKRHPRETDELPTALKNSAHLEIWCDDILKAYQQFKKWYGFNSMPLITASILDYETYFWDLSTRKFKRQTYEKHKRL
jgi:hypothetical protein